MKPECCRPAPFRPVTHVIFDLDGTILDTEGIYHPAIAEIGARYGKSYTSEMKNKVAGSVETDTAKTAVREMDLPISWEDFLQEFKLSCRAKLPDAGYMPDTESIYHPAIEEIGARYGKTFTSEMKNKVAGSVETVTAQTVVREMNLPISWEDFLQQYKNSCKAKLPDAGFMPGAERLIRHLHSNGIPIAIATSSPQEEMDLKTANKRQIFDLFDHVVCGSTDPEVKMGKPAPDIFLVCASRFDWAVSLVRNLNQSYGSLRPPGWTHAYWSDSISATLTLSDRFPSNPNPSQCLVLEDAINGIRGALKAGMQAIMIPVEIVPYELWKEATLRLDSLECFVPELFGLPPFKKGGGATEEDGNFVPNVN